MDRKEQEFLKRLRETFRQEAEEHLRSLSTGLIELEKTTGAEKRAQIVETVFREAHSLKGAARSVNLKEIEALCHPLESALAALKREEIEGSTALFDLFHQVVDFLGHLVANMDGEITLAERSAQREMIRALNDGSWFDQPQTGIPDAANTENRNRKLKPKQKLGQAVGGQPVADSSQPTAGNPLEAQSLQPENSTLPAEKLTGDTTIVLNETVRIPVSKLDPLLLQAEEMIQAKLAGAQRANELQEIEEALVFWKSEWEKSKYQGTASSGKLPEWTSSRLQMITDMVTRVKQAFDQDQRVLRHMIDDHMDAMKRVLMLPVSTLVEVFPRLVRDLERQQGKEIELVIQGANIEVDKRILEELKDPLIHLVRNCVDHGIEKPDERKKAGKPERGKITIAFSARDNRQVDILVADDGAGIDPAKVQSTAASLGLLPSGKNGHLAQGEALALIFESGFSTSQIITDISGRGLGLAIVRDKVEKLGGTVSVDSQPGQGTNFHIVLPLTLATFRGVLIREREHLFILSSSHVERAVRLGLNEIQTVENRETIRLDGQILSLVKLGELLGLPRRNNASANRSSKNVQPNAEKFVFALVLASTEKRIAIQVDEVLSEEEVLVKGLGGQLRRVRNIAGATVLGAGTVVPVLNIADLIESAVRPGAAAGTSTEVEKIPVQNRRILVAEDSITARTLLKNILETDGYQVVTAVDGMDAFTQLRSGDYDLVVSDVDMPRMSGFELTTRIRADKNLGELPVVLVTALESRQDRERGIDVGANAYIVKSSFDQSNLLEVIQRLL